MSDNRKFLEVLDVYNDKAFVYSILCIQSARYFNYLKYMFQLPIIITSSVLSILNGTTGDENVDKHMKIINTIFNITTALVLSINNTFRFESRANNFKSAAQKLQKLSHLIESKILENSINHDFIENIVSTYDNITEGIDDVPSHICKRVKAEYATKKHLPTIINGVQKIDSKIISNASNVLKESSPRVLKTKQFQSDLQV